jgi:hypothetical protein
MDNPETLATFGTQETGGRQTKQGAIKNGQSREAGSIWVHKRQYEDKQNKGQSRMDNPETLATLDTQDTGRRQTKQGAIKNRQSRDTGNIGHTRHRTKTNKTRGNQE